MADSDVGTKRSASQADPISHDDSSDTKRPKTDAEGNDDGPADSDEMTYRILGRTGFCVSALTFGCWQLGLPWEHEHPDGLDQPHPSIDALNYALDHGVNFLDTSDVYGAGLSETLIGHVLKKRREEGKDAGKRIYIATKLGKTNRYTADPDDPANYDFDNMEFIVRQSLERLGVDALDLVQTQGAPVPVMEDGTLFKNFKKLKEMGLIKHFGVSVNTIDEAYLAMDKCDDLSTIMVSYSIFRPRAHEALFAACEERGIGVIARQCLASGMLTGALSKDSVFREDDHRAFNLDGEGFERSNTYAGVPLDDGFGAVDELKAVVPGDRSMAQMSLSWCLQDPRVTTMVVGHENCNHIAANLQSTVLPALDESTMGAIADIYDRRIKAHVHHL